MTLTTAILLNVLLGALLVASLVFLLTHGVHRDRHHRARLRSIAPGRRRHVAS
jgi:hypothetical protein